LMTVASANGVMIRHDKPRGMARRRSSKKYK
jgi:hypothetical protein